MKSPEQLSASGLAGLIADLVDLPGALLPVLHRVQKHFGYVPAAAVPAIAKALNLSRAEVHGVVSFYHDFRQEKAGTHIIKVCQAEACQSMGAEGLTQHITSRLGIQLHGTTTSGAVTLEPVYCLGNCALSPAIMIDNALHGRVTPRRFDELAQALSERTA